VCSWQICILLPTAFGDDGFPCFRIFCNPTSARVYTDVNRLHKAFVETCYLGFRKFRRSRELTGLRVARNFVDSVVTVGFRVVVGNLCNPDFL
jgi:hypothetical protein